MTTYHVMYVIGFLYMSIHTNSNTTTYTLGQNHVCS
ncbi:hypothetical protein Leryth_018775 [Lithospermum erythrorhizon]|nr:hypothetical protein Leryth_018775 [Lithospermum erythrorhizon]